MTSRNVLLLALAVTSIASGPVHAQTADTPDLGRLFFSAERRAALDRQRAMNVQTIRTVQGETLRLDGVVRRSSGKQTVWINGRAQNESGEAETGIGVAINPRQPSRAILRAGDEAATPISVGEAVNRNTGELDTRLNGGRVVVHKPR